MPNLTLSSRAQQSMVINRISSGAIIIAGSGMCTGGRITHHLKHNAWLKGGWNVALGYISGFFVLLAVVGWHPAPKRSKAAQAPVPVTQLAINSGANTEYVVRAGR